MSAAMAHTTVGVASVDTDGAPGNSPFYVGKIDLRQAPRLDRVLLATNGTLTNLLQAEFLERVSVAKIRERLGDQEMLQAALAALALPNPACFPVDPGETLYEREVCLVGHRTGYPYVHARSFLLLDRYPPAVREALASSTPLGLLWDKYQVPIRKHFLCYREVEASPLSVHFGLPVDAPIYRRTYLVLAADGQPISLITESFPKNLARVAAQRGAQPTDRAKAKEA